MSEFRRWYFPVDFLYECQVRSAARQGIDVFLARRLRKTIRGARVSELPEGFFSDVERVRAGLEIIGPLRHGLVF